MKTIKVELSQSQLITIRAALLDRRFKAEQRGLSVVVDEATELWEELYDYLNKFD